VLDLAPSVPPFSGSFLLLLETRRAGKSNLRGEIRSFHQYPPDSIQRYVQDRGNLIFPARDPRRPHSLADRKGVPGAAGRTVSFSTICYVTIFSVLLNY